VGLVQRHHQAIQLPRAVAQRAGSRAVIAAPRLGSATDRISPRPGARSEDACASSSTPYASASFGNSLGATAVAMSKTVRVRVRIGSVASSSGSGPSPRTPVSSRSIAASLLGLQREPEDVEALGDAVQLDRSRHGADAVLDVPAEDHLRCTRERHSQRRDSMATMSAHANYLRDLGDELRREQLADHGSRNWIRGSFRRNANRNGEDR